MALSMATILNALPSCKSHSSLQLTVDSLKSKVSQSQLSTVNSQLSTAIRDSVIFRERTIHDTVYITKEVYRDRLHSTLNSQHSTLKDTVVVTEWREKVIEHPPERYIPPFYKHCTAILFIILAAGVVYIVGKWYIKFRL